MINPERLVIDGWTAPMHSNYLMDWRKVYVESPQRTPNGNFVFGRSFEVPFFKAVWDLMLINDYMKFSEFFKKDECSIRYLDTRENIHKIAKFAILQPNIGSFHILRSAKDGVTNLQIDFDGSLN